MPLAKFMQTLLHTSWLFLMQGARISQTLAKKKETTINQMTSFVKALKA